MARTPLVTSKVFSEESGDFSETVEFTVLHCANVTGNNNKFYCIEIQKNPKTRNYRLFSNYGRLETSGVFEIREEDKQGNSLDYDRCKVEYDSLIKKKQRGKNVTRPNGEKIREKYSIVDVVSPTVGSTNIRHASEIKVSRGASAPLVSTKDRDADSSRIINMMVSENIHNITSNTTIRFTSNGFETSLGPVTEPHIDKAKAALDTLRDQMNGSSQLNSSLTDVKDANSQYFSLIPRKFGYRITASDMILTPDKLAEEYDLLDNLRTAVQAGLSAGDEEQDNRISIDLSVLSHGDSEFKRLEDKFETTKHSSHAGGRQYHVRNIYTLDIPAVREAYEPTALSLGNTRELFHGTRTANMLSISLKGLIIPPTGAAHVTGRMFGNGVYGASCSTKALNYAIGYWSGGYRSSRTSFVLIVNFAMGREYVATSHRYSGAPAGYDSVWGKAGHALLNDEFIVYKLNQATITHVLELEK